MGLDMYLKRKTYVRNWDFMSKNERHNIIVKKGDEIREDINPERISDIVELICDWRKANQIHKWFVDNVQKGNDDCGEYYVSREKLESLVEACKKVLNTRSAFVAQEELPTQSGFFFGSTDYDDYYFGDLERTVECIESALKENNDGYYYYSSSW